MTTQNGPLFYQPVFGNDNGYAGTATVDVAAFSAPTFGYKDAAFTAAPARKPAK